MQPSEQTKVIARIIAHKLPWEIVDSSGKVVSKPAGRDELELLLILHRDSINVRAVQPNQSPQ